MRDVIRHMEPNIIRDQQRCGETPAIPPPILGGGILSRLGSVLRGDLALAAAMRGPKGAGNRRTCVLAGLGRPRSR